MRRTDGLGALLGSLTGESAFAFRIGENQVMCAAVATKNCTGEFMSYLRLFKQASRFTGLLIFCGDQFLLILFTSGCQQPLTSEMGYAWEDGARDPVLLH